LVAPKLGRFVKRPVQPVPQPAVTIAAPQVAALRRAMIAWFRRGHREMPWRSTKDPYAIWVSEIMLQQTRVETVRGYYTRWMARLPTVRALAAASLDEVLALWSGLGYYARARNLKAAAEQLVAQDRGEVPRDAARLRALPGVGAYTAGAIASIAFGLPEPILDGNVARVLSRIFLIDEAPEATTTKARLWSLASALVPKDAASDFNQSMMELGATVCTPRDPACSTCPVADPCVARAAGRQHELPRKKARRAVPTVFSLALVLRSKDGRRVLLGRRPAKGLWGGLWEPPCAPLTSAEEAGIKEAKQVAAGFGLELARPVLLDAVSHELTHRRYLFHPILATAGTTPAPVDAERGYEALRWVDRAEVEQLGLSAWATRIVAAALPAPVATPSATKARPVRRPKETAA